MVDKRKSPEGTEEKRAFVHNRQQKIDRKAKLSRGLTSDQISVVEIQLDVPGRGRMRLGGGGLGSINWDADLTDNKADSDPTDQFFDMDAADMINDMDPCDPLRRGGGSPPIIA